MRVVLLLLGASAVLIPFFAACGGNVVHSPGQGGSSGSLGNTSATSVDAVSNTSAPGVGTMSISSSSGVPSDVCTDFCAKHSELMCTTMPDCLSNCAHNIAGACSAEYAAVFQCVTDLAVDCNFPQA